MKIKIKVKDFLKKHIFLRKIARKVYIIKNKLIYKINTMGIKVDEKTIIFGCFNGRSYCDSPKAIYQYMINCNEYKDFNFIWTFEDVKSHEYLKNNSNTRIVKYKVKEFYKALAKSKYWIFNYKIQDHIFPKKNQIFLQCWHGTPLKRLGCDLEHFNNAMNSISEIRQRYHIEANKFNYFISPSKFATEKFISIWDLERINKADIIIEEGYPRNDFLINFKQKDIDNIKKKLKIYNINKKVILYAPTYRDNQHSSKDGYTYKTEVDFEKLKEELQDEYIILFRSHWLVANNFDFDKYKGFIYNVSDYDDINELYVISDLLITDYSSVFFDYANLKRPIIFYMYDLEDYRDNIRGFYLDLEELPGKILQKEEEIIEEIRNTMKNFNYDEKYKKFNEKFNYLDDGQASKRVIEKIIKK